MLCAYFFIISSSEKCCQENNKVFAGVCIFCCNRGAVFVYYHNRFDEQYSIHKKQPIYIKSNSDIPPLKIHYERKIVWI